MPFAIGYITLEGFERAISAEYDILAALLCESKTSMSGQRKSITFYVLVSQPMDDEVHYCRIPVGTTDSFLQSPIEMSEIEKAAKQGWMLIQVWLKEHGHHYHEAVVGIPKDIEPIFGSADFLVRVPGSKTYARMDAQE